MNLLQMSVSGAVMIVAVIVVRALTVNRLPKKIFVLLWGVVLFRLAVPFSVPSMWSAYTFVSRNEPIQEVMADIPQNPVIAQVAELQMNANPAPVENMADSGQGMSNWQILWMAGAVLCAVFFAVSYLRCYLEFRTSLPVSDEYASRWLQEHPLKRTVRMRQSDRIAAPLTYGILCPVILMPKKTEWSNRQQLQYILLHEYMHICHFDMVWKLAAVFVLCIHWFNPLVWAMYILFNRDIELSCDESVVRRFGQTSKSTYARTLLSMEESRSSLTPLCNNFSKNAIEERITAIMKIRKVTTGVILLSIAVVVSIVVLFATSAEAKEKQMLFVLGRLYAFTGQDVSDMVAEEAAVSELDSPHIGFIASTVAETERPEEELQSNFGYIGSEVIFNGSGIAVNMDGKWIQFEIEDNTLSTGEEVTQNTEGMLGGSIEAPASVQEAALRLMGRKYADAEPGIYSNWRIASLEHVYTYDDLNGMMLQIYRMNYEFLAADPEKLVPAGGMTMDADGWVVPEYADSTYLVFEQTGEDLSYRAHLMENDCLPGEELFTSDLLQELGSSESAGNVRENTAVITCMLEGMPEEMPATLYVGDGFSIYIPDDGWQIYDETLEEPNLMAAVYSSGISVGVARYRDKASADVTADMAAEGYSYDEYSGKLQRFDGEGEEQLLLEARVYGQDNDVWVVSTSFPAAYEWGSRLDAIADTFALTVDGGRNILPAGPEETPVNETALELEDRMNAFYNAYFQGDVDWIKQLLTKDYSWDVDVYEDLERADEVEITREIKGLDNVDAEGSADSYTLSLEFRNPDEDSLTYLTAEFVKENGEWKISFYGLEK